MKSELLGRVPRLFRDAGQVRTLAKIGDHGQARAVVTSTPAVFTLIRWHPVAHGVFQENSKTLSFAMRVPGETRWLTNDRDITDLLKQGHGAHEITESARFGR